MEKEERTFKWSLGNGKPLVIKLYDASDEVAAKKHIRQSVLDTSLSPFDTEDQEYNLTLFVHYMYEQLQSNELLKLMKVVEQR
mgnify:FL=1|jgi:hypothetical protein|tara:strand:+ start:394 stop:642 length:249 start_codon:yes stop_codon:yes gene_type:complete